MRWVTDCFAVSEDAYRDGLKASLENGTASMRKLFSAAALAIALAAFSSPSRAASEVESCAPAPVIEDPILRADLDGKADYIKWAATSRDDALQGITVMLETYPAGVERQLATESVRRTVCVMVKDPDSDLTPEQRDILGWLLPNLKTR